MTQKEELKSNGEVTLSKPAKAETSFAVFWIEAGRSRHELFILEDVREPLAWCEELRKLAKNGAPISHVCISSDVTSNVGEPGVSDKLPEGYNWTMRRRAFVPGRDPSSVPAWKIDAA